MILGEYIKKYREENGLSMDKFAEISGISKSYVHVLEKGLRPDSNTKICPQVDKIKKAADAMGMSFSELFNSLDEIVSVIGDDILICDTANDSPTSIPVLGKVAAGVPIDAIEDVIGQVVIPESLKERGDFFGLRIKGDSMEPRIYDGDIVVVLKSETAESGDIVIASVHEDDAVCKKYLKRGKKHILHSLNEKYDDIDVTTDPDFRILGIVVELRAELKDI